MDAVNKKTAKGLVWSLIDRFAGQGIQFLMSLVIARLVLPSDYGLIAMLMVFMAIAQTFVDSGFGSALVQKKDRTDVDFSTVFLFNGAVALVCYLLLFLAAPLIASFYRQPELVLVTRVAGLTLLINALGAVQLARLTITLDFKKIAVATLTGVTLSGALGIWMAYKGHGVWALVAQTLTFNVLYNGLLWVISVWKPSLAFSRSAFKSLFSFGSKLLMSSLLHTLYVNLYSLVIGRLFSSKDLGYYNRSSVLAMFPSTNLSNVIYRVVYPVQCQLQDDKEAMVAHFIQYVRLSCYVIFPIMIGFCVLAEPLVLVLLKAKWLPAVPYLQILCLAYMWDAIMKLNGAVINAKGRSDLFFKAEIYKKIVGFIILAATVPFGIKVMCYGLILYAFADIRIISFYTHQLVGLKLMTQIKAISPSLSLAVMMGAVVWLASCCVDNPWLKLGIGVPLGVLLYVGASALFSVREFVHLRGLVKEKLKI
ncbi:MAG: lipopolysaccharide biosynthesis protein [Bacteroidales bacterium]|nr:lipopolysaccharide biosynthesis protein [Bacteroidales bacterium]